MDNIHDPIGAFIKVRTALQKLSTKWASTYDNDVKNTIIDLKVIKFLLNNKFF